MKQIIYLIAVVVAMFFGSPTNVMAQDGEHHHHHHHHHSEQHVINPATGLYHESFNGYSFDINFYNYHITKVEKKMSGTSIHIMLCSDKTGSTWINGKTKLIDNTTGATYYLSSTQNITANEYFNVTEGVPFEFVLNFPMVMRACESISIEEPTTSGHNGIIIRNITGFSADYEQ